MAIKLLKVGNSFNVPQKTYICDTETERDNLQAYFGDLALVIESGLTYILNSEGTWMDYPTGGGGGADTTLIAPDFEDTKAYSQYTLICYDGKLYRALTNVPAGEWDETKWEEVDIASAKADLIDGKVPASQLPSYVDDVLEYANRAAFPQQGESGKIYVAIDSGYTYRWSGSEYIPIGTIFNEVHIGPNAPTGDETIWIKPEGRNQAADTVDSKNVGDWIYLEETMNGVTKLVRFLILSKDSVNNKAVIVRESNDVPGYRVDPPDLQGIYEGNYDDDIKACYSAATSDWQVYGLKYPGIVNPYLEPGETSDILPGEMTLKQMYGSIQTTDWINCRLGATIGTTLQWAPGPPWRVSVTPVQTYQGQEFIDYAEQTEDWFIPRGLFTACYIAVAFEVPLDSLLVNIDGSISKYENYIIRLKQNGQWNTLDDLKVATLAQALELKNRVIDLENKELVKFCTLTKSNDVYSCDTSAEDIYKAFKAGIKVYINYMGVLIPVINTIYDSENDKYHVSATVTTIFGEELLGRRIAFDGTDWSVDFNESFIVRGAGSLANIGKYLKATADGVMWDTPEGGGTIEALSAEEMLELFEETDLTENAGVGYIEYTEDPNGEYVYDEEIKNYRPYEEGDTGTRYSADEGYAGWVEDGETYILTY